MNKKVSPLDERNLAVIGKISIFLYVLTIYFLIGDMIYREFWLHQKPGQFEDIAALTIANLILFVGLNLYYGGVSVGRFSFKKLLSAYIVAVVAGMTFASFKYNEFSLPFLLNMATRIVTITAVMFIAAGAFAYIGKRRIDRDIE
jgi:hypothetical protein